MEQAKLMTDVQTQIIRYLAKGPSNPPGSNPIESVQLRFEDTKFRYMNCPSYHLCLDHAAHMSWTSFICTDCQFYVQPMNRKELP